MDPRFILPEQTVTGLKWYIMWSRVRVVSLVSFVIQGTWFYVDKYNELIGFSLYILVVFRIERGLDAEQRYTIPPP